MNKDFQEMEKTMMSFVKNNPDKCEAVLGLLTRYLVRSYMAWYGAKNSKALVDYVQECFDHYQEVVNLMGYKE